MSIAWFRTSMRATQANEPARSREDKDWLKDSRDLALPDSQRASILQALEGEPGLSSTESTCVEDSKLLVRSRLIDYSLIVGRLVYQLEPCEERSLLGSLEEVSVEREVHRSGVPSGRMWGGGLWFGRLLQRDQGLP